MKHNKLFIVLCAICLFFLNLSTSASAAGNIALEDKNVAFQDDKLIITILEDTNTYGLTKIEDLEKGTVEYLESTLVDGEMVVMILDEDKEPAHTIDIVGNDILLDEEKVGSITESVTHEAIKVFDYETQSMSWKLRSTTYGDSSWRVVHGANMVTIIAAVLSYLTLLGAGSALVISLATNMVGWEIPTTYWKRYNYVDANATYNTCKTSKETYFYEHSNLSGYVGNSGRVIDSIDACNSGY